jgi:hypothetical protein
MALKYEGEKVTRVGNGNGGNGLGYLFKMFFGNDPALWVRFVLLGLAFGWAFHVMIEFRDTMIAESQAVRRSLNEYIAANEKWQAVSAEERTVLIGRVDSRFKRLYIHNGWDYQGLRE